MLTLHNEWLNALALMVLVIAGVLFIGTVASAQDNAPFTLKSEAFADGTRIPDRFTCTGKNVSPALAWSGVPTSAVSLALIVDDPDASGKPWVHWVVYNIEPKATGFPEGVSLGIVGALSGTTSFKSLGYGGPCPPVGRGTHHYIFTLYALSAKPELTEGATKEELLSAMDGITIATTVLTGLYSR